MIIEKVVRLLKTINGYSPSETKNTFQYMKNGLHIRISSDWIRPLTVKKYIPMNCAHFNFYEDDVHLRNENNRSGIFYTYFNLYFDNYNLTNILKFIMYKNNIGNDKCYPLKLPTKSMTNGDLKLFLKKCMKVRGIDTYFDEMMVTLI